MGGNTFEKEAETSAGVFISAVKPTGSISVTFTSKQIMPFDFAERFCYPIIYYIPELASIANIRPSSVIFNNATILNHRHSLSYEEKQKGRIYLLYKLQVSSSAKPKYSICLLVFTLQVSRYCLLVLQSSSRPVYIFRQASSQTIYHRYC